MTIGSFKGFLPMMDLVYCVFEDFFEGRGGGWARSLKRPELISNTLLNLLTFG